MPRWVLLSRALACFLQMPGICAHSWVAPGCMPLFAAPQTSSAFSGTGEFPSAFWSTSSAPSLLRCVICSSSLVSQHHRELSLPVTSESRPESRELYRHWDLSAEVAEGSGLPHPGPSLLEHGMPSFLSPGGDNVYKQTGVLVRGP